MGVVEACDGPSPIVWKICLDKDLAREKSTQKQTEVHNLKEKVTANFLKFRLVSGHEDFATVHHISLQGKVVGRSAQMFARNSAADVMKQRGGRAAESPF